MLHLCQFCHVEYFSSLGFEEVDKIPHLLDGVVQTVELVYALPILLRILPPLLTAFFWEDGCGVLYQVQLSAMFLGEQFEYWFYNKCWG